MFQIELEHGHEERVTEVTWSTSIQPPQLQSGSITPKMNVCGTKVLTAIFFSFSESAHPLVPQKKSLPELLLGKSF